MNKIKLRFGGDWQNPVAPRKGFRLEKTSKHWRQKIGKKKV